MSDEREALYLVSYFLLIYFFALLFSTRLKKYSQVESAGFSYSGIVHHGHRPGGAENERHITNKSNHHQDHESAQDSTRYTYAYQSILAYVVHTYIISLC